MAPSTIRLSCTQRLVGTAVSKKLHSKISHLSLKTSSNLSPNTIGLSKKTRESKKSKIGRACGFWHPLKGMKLCASYICHPKSKCPRSRKKLQLSLLGLSFTAGTARRFFLSKQSTTCIFCWTGIVRMWRNLT